MQDQDTGQAAKGLIASWGWGCIGVIIVCIVLYFAMQFFDGRFPISTLPVKEFSESELRTWDIQRVCLNSTNLWPPSAETLSPKFPVYSPNGRWYITVIQVTYRKAEEMRLYEAGSNRFIGSYSYNHLTINCWAKDSSGIYLEDYVPGNGGFINITYWSSNPKEILVPILNNTNGATP